MKHKSFIFLVVLMLAAVAVIPAFASNGSGATTANGWYEGEEIYYVLGGIEDVNDAFAAQQHFLHLTQQVMGVALAQSLAGLVLAVEDARVEDLHLSPLPDFIFLAEFLQFV